MDAASYARLQSRFDAIEQAIRTAREEMQGLQDDAVARYGRDGAHLIVLAIGTLSEAVQKVEEKPLLDLYEELGQTEAEDDEHQLERAMARAS